MSIQVVTYLLSCMALLVLTLLVYLKNPKKIQNRVFALFIFFGFCYLASLGIADIVKQPVISLWAIKIGLIFTNFIGFLLVTLAVIFPTHSKQYRHLPIITFVLAVIFSILVLMPGFLNTVVITSSGTDLGSVGITYYLQELFVAGCVAAGIVIFILKLKKANSLEKNQIRFIVYITIFYAIVNLLLVNVLPLLLDLPGIGPLLTAPSALILFAGYSYVIIRHKLFDVRLVVVRALAFVVSIGVLGVIYGILAFQIVTRALPADTSTSMLQAIYIILAIVIAFTFQPIRRFFEKISNKVFYRDNYDSQALINEVGRVLSGEIHLEILCTKISNLIATQMKLNFVDIVIFDRKNKHGNASFVSSGKHMMPEVDLMKLGRLIVVADNISTGERKEVMEKYGLSVSLALRTSEDFIGYLLLGDKKSGSIYYDNDIRVLKIIANELSVGLQNAKAFAEIQAFNETLQAKVNDATKRLRHANSELKELDEAKDEFISIASHQLRTPLTTVKGYASMISEGDFGKLSAKQKEPVTEILDGSERMNRLVGDLLNVSRIQAGKFYIDTVELDFEQLVAGEVKQLEQLAKSKKVELVYKPPAKKLAPMMLDQNKTEQAVMNLIDNAIHYSASPGGGHVQVSLEVHGNEVVFLVRDDGIGVPRDKQAKLFTKMFRADNAKEVRPDGTGLGLYLVKRVVEDEGGHVVFASEPGKGSTFGFRLPIGGVPKELQQKAKSIAKHVHLSV